MEDVNSKLPEIVLEPRKTPVKKPAACKLRDMPFDQRKLEKWVK